MQYAMQFCYAGWQPLGDPVYRLQVSFVMRIASFTIHDESYLSPATKGLISFIVYTLFHFTLTALLGILDSVFAHLYLLYRWRWQATTEGDVDATHD